MLCMKGMQLQMTGPHSHRCSSLICPEFHPTILSKYNKGLKDEYYKYFIKQDWSKQRIDSNVVLQDFIF